MPPLLFSAVARFSFGTVIAFCSVAAFSANATALGSSPHKPSSAGGGRHKAPVDPGPAALQAGETAMEAENQKELIERKFKEIIIPKLEFREATTREAIAFLKKKFTELSPDHLEINIVIRQEGANAKAPASAPPGNPPDPDPSLLTVSLLNTPIGDVFRYVAGRAGLKLEITDYALVMSELGTLPKPLIAREWKAPPEMFARGAVDFLTKRGVTFPDGSWAVFEQTNSTLNVQNTAENLRLIEQILGSAR